MSLEDAEEELEEEEDVLEVETVGKDAEPVFGGDGVRGLTSTTFRLKPEKDDDADVVEEEEEADAADAADGGDEDLDRGTTSTTLNDDERELEGVLSMTSFL